MPLARFAVLLVLLAVACAGCGEQAGRPAQGPQPAAAVPAPEPLPFVTLDHPGRRPVLARRTDDALRATATVSGRGNAGDPVRVTARCTDPRCDVWTQVDGHGRWSARVLLLASPQAPRVRLAAQAGSQVAIGLARLRVRPPRRAARRRTPRTAPASTASAPVRASRAARTTAAAPPAPRAATGAPSTMVMVGDSLAVGTRDALTGLLAGWAITTDARVSRPLAEGMGIIRSLPSRPHVLAVSLFTNDAPGATAALQAAVRETVAGQTGHGCVIWATIVRPPVGGVTYARANAVLAQLAAANPRVMRLVPWAAQVAAHPEWVGADGVHATPAGYAARARLYADAARGCV